MQKWRSMHTKEHAKTNETTLVLIHWQKASTSYDVWCYNFLFLFLIILCQHRVMLHALYTLAHNSRFSMPVWPKLNRAVQTLASSTLWTFSGFIRSRYLGEINTIAIIYTVRNRRLHTSRVRLAYLYAACSLYTLNGKWHTHVAKWWSIGWYNPHVTSYTVGIHCECTSCQKRTCTQVWSTN